MIHVLLKRRAKLLVHVTTLAGSHLGFQLVHTPWTIVIWIEQQPKPYRRSGLGGGPTRNDTRVSGGGGIDLYSIDWWIPHQIISVTSCPDRLTDPDRHWWTGLSQSRPVRIDWWIPHRIISVSPVQIDWQIPHRIISVRSCPDRLADPAPDYLSHVLSGPPHYLSHVLSG